MNERARAEVFYATNAHWIALFLLSFLVVRLRPSGRVFRRRLALLRYSARRMSIFSLRRCGGDSNCRAGLERARLHEWRVPKQQCSVVAALSRRPCGRFFPP